MSDYHKLLGIDEFASLNEIKSAYKQLAKKWHPDLNQDKIQAEKMMTLINEAYSELKKTAPKVRIKPKSTSTSSTNSKSKSPYEKLDDGFFDFDLDNLFGKNQNAKNNQVSINNDIVNKFFDI